PYNALPYTWGSPGPMVEMVVNDQRMSFRKNLEQALRIVRGSRVARAIWVDAICIDQSSTAERSRQVARMFGIYDRAIEVICYVGK
ncbi:heterokaryon incompatibility, partial [Colletotrichum sublineola]